MNAAAPGRRAAASTAPRRRFGASLVLAAVLPLATAGALTVVSTSQDAVRQHPPETTPLTRADLGCPAGQRGAEQIAVLGGNAETAGELGLRALPGDAAPLPLTAGRPAVRTERRSAVVAAEGDLAPGLTASRTGRRAGVDCSTPQARSWLTGLGARPQHSTVVELINPDAGPAIADLTVLSAVGPLGVGDLRGIRVPGHSSVRLDLARIVPRRTELAAEVTVSRGRLSVSAWDRVDQLGLGPASGDWLPTQAEPATSSTLLGLPPGEGQRRLVLANFGPDEARVDLRVIAPESTFAPEGAEEIVVAPGTIRTVSVDGLLDQAIRDRAVGLEIEASRPVTATLRSFVAGDVSHAVAAPFVTDLARAAVLPGARAQVLIAAAPARGVATVVSRDADGRRLDRTRVEVVPERGTAVDLPEGAAYVEVRLARTGAAVTLVSGPAPRQRGWGTVVLPMRQLSRDALVPDVRPGLP